MSDSGPPTRGGGRPTTIDADDIIAAGRALGMRDLSLSAVAARLGVTPAALYRHVDGRWGLERLVGESLLADLDLADDPEADVEAHLVGFAAQLRAFVLEHPGLAAYLQTSFPRGSSGAALLMSEVAALEHRGYDTAAALVLANATAALTIGLAAGEDHRAAAGQENMTRQEENAVRIVAEHPALGEGFARIPRATSGVYDHLIITAAIGGLVAAAPVGRLVEEVIADLSRRGGLLPTAARTAGGGGGPVAAAEPVVGVEPGAGVEPAVGVEPATGTGPGAGDEPAAGGGPVAAAESATGAGSGNAATEVR